MNEHPYTLDHYIHILSRANAEGYKIKRLRDLIDSPRPERYLLIRHDVDITPWAALEMAELEASRATATSYYFRLHSNTYNLLTAPVADAVRAILRLGHEVGLHYEPGYFIERGLDPAAGVRRDINIFEDFIGEKTATIAQHQPAEGPRLLNISDRHRCAYEPEFVREIKYFADSGFHWREGCICTKLGVHPRIHTLIHPHSWVTQSQDWREALRVHADNLAGRVLDEMEEYIQSIEIYLSKRPGIDRARDELYDTEHADKPENK
ncbi:MAG: hypothetical protein HY286_13850 [Planctomycetes bacterium]|nr:hypothetical protein [Planctomycetota bacterium]